MSARFTPPSQSTFGVSLLVAIVAIIGLLAEIPLVSEFSLWILLAAYLILVAGVVFRGI